MQSTIFRIRFHRWLCGALGLILLGCGSSGGGSSSGGNSDSTAPTVNTSNQTTGTIRDLAPRRKIPENEPFLNLRIYQVMVESFIDGDPTRNFNTGYGTSHHRGDLKGITQALPYIKSLGLNAIWLTPIFDSEGEEKLDATGYFARNYFAIDPHFGTLEEAKTMVETAHQLGLYVFFDGVFGHHKGNPKASPQGRLPTGGNNPVSYPGSLEFYQEVATYWIDTLEIDGWRLDQAYQVPVDSWKAIREAVEAKTAERKKAGKQWGTLGYMVAEIWDGENNISTYGYGKAEAPGLLSAFDFPTRYRLVQVLAAEESGAGNKSTALLNEGLLTHQIYPPHALPNLMLTNHDLVRFGDLIQRAGLGGKETPEYWKRHKAALSFLAAYTGPITIYYGDEIGDEVSGFSARVTTNCADRGLCDDHVSRTSGQISGFDPQQEELKNYVTALMKLRAEHPALWGGESRNIISNGAVHADYKSRGQDRLIYVLNASTQAQIITFNAEFMGANLLRDGLDQSVLQPEQGNFRLTLEGLTARFLLIE